VLLAAQLVERPIRVAKHIVLTLQWTRFIARFFVPSRVLTRLPPWYKNANPGIEHLRQSVGAVGSPSIGPRKDRECTGPWDAVSLNPGGATSTAVK
jgi:hypothetical protein